MCCTCEQIYDTKPFNFSLPYLPIPLVHEVELTKLCLLFFFLLRNEEDTCITVFNHNNDVNAACLTANAMLNGDDGINTSGCRCELYYASVTAAVFEGRSGSGSGSSGGDYTATSSSSFEQVVISRAAVIERVGGQAEGGTQAVIETSRSARIPSVGSGFRLRTRTNRHRNPSTSPTSTESYRKRRR